MKSVLVVAALAFIADAPNADEAQATQGDWPVVSLSSNGSPKALKSTSSIRIDDKHFKEGNNPKHWTGYTLDTDATPKQVDFSNGRKGIYDLNGDELRICHHNERPTNFDGGVLIVLKRRK